MNYIESETFWEWVKAHCDEDCNRLRLRYHKQMATEIDMAILQIECRQKTAKKLYETLSNNRFFFPTALSAEQCTSDLLAKFHSSLIPKNAKVLDMTSGLGIDVFNIAGKAISVTAIEIDSNVANALKYNAKTLGLDNINVINADCTEYIHQIDEFFDVIFIDPARRGTQGKRLFALSDCQPDIIVLLPALSKKCNRLIIKASPMLDITQLQRELNTVTNIYSIGTHNECKELVAVIDFKQEYTTCFIHSVTLCKDHESIESFTQEEEDNTSYKFTTPTENEYLYEPFPAVMKTAPFKLLSSRYNVGKLEAHTHLYSSTALIKTFPGEIFQIKRIINFSSKEIKRFASEYPCINVATRNFPMSANDLRRKLRVKDGGNLKAIGCTITDGSKVILILQKMQ